VVRLQRKIFFSWLSFFLILPLVVSAGDEYKPYLHKPVVPESPTISLYGAYSTNLFPGAGTYAYSLEVPKGTNKLQPSLTISYNSQSVKQRPSILGAGWFLSQSYIMRDVNFTPSNEIDDRYVLILNGASHDLVYEGNYYHTKRETFSRIHNVTGGDNSKNQYWLVTLKDGTKLRFGYNADSELFSSYDYAFKWSLDKVEDVYGNHIFYSYLEDPFVEDKGSVYPLSITYNNDTLRKVSFSYETLARPDRRRVFEQGNLIEESRRLSDVTIFFNNSIVRRYGFTYKNLNSQKSLSSLATISYFGSDNVSKLHNVSFDYHSSTSSYYNDTSFLVPTVFTTVAGDDQGVRQMDVDNNGYLDYYQGRQVDGKKTAWLNNKTNWVEAPHFAPPDFVVDGSYKDYGMRNGKIDNNDFPDLIRAWGGVKDVWLNNGSGFVNASILWNPPVNFVTAAHHSTGAVLVDFNCDGRDDIVVGRASDSTKLAYLNTGSGWKNVSDIWILPEFVIEVDGTSNGVKFADANGDKCIDQIISKNKNGVIVQKTYLNNGSGWTNTSDFVPPVFFTTDEKPDTGVREIEANGDGLLDFLEDYANSTTSENSAWINNGTGWIENNHWISPEHFIENNKNIGRRIGDANGDGDADIIVSYHDGGGERKSVFLRNTTYAFMLANITNEFGGITSISYDQSTKFDNTGKDDFSDLGFNVWVVGSVLTDNSVGKSVDSSTNETTRNDFNILSNTTYKYQGGFFDHNNSEFRGFALVNETLPDNSTISHYFHQSEALKGEEYKTETYGNFTTLFLTLNNNFEVIEKTTEDGNYFIINLGSTSRHLYDGTTSAFVTNTSFFYNNYSDAVEKISHGDTSSEGDKRYERYEYIYNQSTWILGKLSTYTLLGADNTSIFRKTKYAYDGNEHGSSPSKGSLTKKEYWLDTISGYVSSYYNYDAFGNIVEHIDTLGRIATYEYGLTDATNTFAERVTNPLGHSTTFVYDVGTGNVLYERKNGITTSFFYDVFGRIKKEIRPYDSISYPTKSYLYEFDGVAPEKITASQKTSSNKTLDSSYFYDGFTNVLQLKTPAESNEQIVKNLFYDGLNRVIKEQNPFFITSFVNLSNISDSASFTTYDYDALSRIIKVINPDGTTKETSYGRLEIDDIDENDHFKTYYLDAYDRITAVEEHNKDFYLEENETYNTSYSYNEADDLVSVRDHFGNNFNFTFDSLGRKLSLIDPDLGTWTYEYDRVGNLIKQSDNGGNEIFIGYDPLNRITHRNTSSQVLSFTYDEDYQGTLTSKNTSNITYGFKYDDRLRVIEEITNIRNHTLVKRFTYDSKDRILETRLPDNEDLDFFYDKVGKVSSIPGYNNETSYNSFGSPLHWTYFNSRNTSFDYNDQNARLNRIATDSIQELNYSYDFVGNIVGIEDEVNNKSYSMSYDDLDRLNQVSINEYKWVYHIDAIANVLKIVRNFSTTTSFKMNSLLPHTPSKIITTQTGTDVLDIENINTTSKTKIFSFTLVNEKNSSLENTTWQAEFGDGSLVTSSESFNLLENGSVLVIVEHTYSKGGHYLVNLTGKINSTKNDYETFPLLFGTEAEELRVAKQNATLIVTHFSARNTVGDFSTDWGWNCNNKINSTIPFNMSTNQELLVIMEHNYTGTEKNLTCTVNSSDGNQTIFLPLTYPGINIEDYNSTVIDSNTIRVKFQIKNYFTTLNVSWNISSGIQFYESSSDIFLSQGESITVIQDINYTFGGLKSITVNIGANNFTDSYTDIISIYWLGIEEFYNTIKNATTRVFNFIVHNENSLNTSARWNITDLGLESSTFLDENESVIVVIEENYVQGKKSPTIRVFNNTRNEGFLTDVFTIKQIEIVSFETLFESNTSAITSSLIQSNAEGTSIAWQLNNSESLISSNQNIDLNASDSAIVIIESNFSESGVFPLHFYINSSQFNDNETGVAIS